MGSFSHYLLSKLKLIQCKYTHIHRGLVPLLGSKAWLDPETGKVYLSKELLVPGKCYEEVKLLPGPWEGLVLVERREGEQFLVGVHELVF